QVRFIESLVASSWMALLFGLPAFIAYGVVYRAGIVFYLGVVATLVPFLVIPAALGVLAATAIVLVFSARRVRDVLLVASPALAAAVYLGIRLLRPESLASPSGLAGFAAFLADVGEPSPWLWSQLAVLLALVVVYVYNFSVLPLDDGSPLAAAMREMAALLNLGLAAFVTTSVAVRFVYPAPSLEGRSWWVLRTAPIPLAA